MTPIIFGIVNITEDSFSDGGDFLSSDAAIAHAREMKDADVIDIGAAASNINSKPVASETEIERLSPVVDALQRAGRSVSIDTFSSEVQRWALRRKVDYLNDIQGFPDEALYPDLAASKARLVVMHSIQGRGRADKTDVPADQIFDRVCAFFAQRLAALTAAGIEKSRLILDPGMGFFLGGRPETSWTMLSRIDALKAEFHLPVFISVSRKSFLRALTGREVGQTGAATLAAELFAARKGADFIRTHDPASLADALKVLETLDDFDQRL